MSVKTMRVLDRTGDTAFKMSDKESIAKAMARFDELMAGGGHIAFTGTDPQSPHKRVDKFSDLQEDTLVMPKLQGG